MLPDVSEKPLVLELRPSRYLFAYLLILHLLLFLALAMPLAIPALLHVVLVSGVAGSFVWHLLRYLPQRQLRQQQRLVWQSDGNWQIESSHGQVSAAGLCPDSWLSAWLVILRLRLENGRRISIPILPDSLETDTFRRLRSRLSQARFAEREPVSTE